MKSYISIALLAIVLSALCVRVAGQEQTRPIILQQAENRSPIAHVDYIYGMAKGLSDQAGTIRLTFIPGEVLYLSHIELGEIRLSAEEVVNALREGKLILKPGQGYMLEPVTVLALRPLQVAQSKLNVLQYDRLQHDAGAFLGSLTTISNIRKSGSYGFDPVYRGFKYDQLNLVIDGMVSATTACPSRMDPPASQISLNQIDRIEILKGPHTLRYGPSFGATLNFISYPPVFSESSDIFGRTTLGYEFNGNIRRGEAILGFSGKRYNIGVNGTYSIGDNYKDGEGISIPSSFKRGALGLTAAYKLSESQFLDVSATRNFARDTDFPSLMMDLRSDDTWLLNAKHKWIRSGKFLSEWNSAIYTSQVDHAMDNLSRPMAGKMSDAVTLALTETYGARTEMKLNWKNAKMYLGADTRHEQISGDRTRTIRMGAMKGKVFIDNVWQDGEIARIGAFTEYHYMGNKYRFTFSGRLDYNHSTAHDPAPKFSEVQNDVSATHLNPSLSIGATRLLGKYFSIGAWVGRGLRSPNLNERFINFLAVGMDPYELVGNPQLNPEINNQADITLIYKQEKTQVEVNLFGSYLQDFISSEIRPDLKPMMTGAPGVRQYVNIDKAGLYGFDLTWRQRFSASLQQELSLAYSVGEELVRKEPLPQIAPMDLRYKLRGNFLQERLQPEIALRHVLKQDRIASYFGEQETPAFSVIDLKIVYVPYARLNLSFAVLNLLDEGYWEHLSRYVSSMSRAIYSPGRNFTLGMNVNL